MHIGLFAPRAVHLFTNREFPFQMFKIIIMTIPTIGSERSAWLIITSKVPIFSYVQGFIQKEFTCYREGRKTSAYLAFLCLLTSNKSATMVELLFQSIKRSIYDDELKFTDKAKDILAGYALQVTSRSVR